MKDYYFKFVLFNDPDYRYKWIRARSEQEARRTLKLEHIWFAKNANIHPMTVVREIEKLKEVPAAIAS